MTALRLHRRERMQTLMDDVPAGQADAAVNDGRPAGDCLRACVASVLDLDASDVPHFVQYVEHPAGTDSHLWWWALVGFCAAHGWRVDYLAFDVNTPAPKGWALAEGKSQRAHDHVVVCHDGKLIHDPHPSDAWLVRIDGWFRLTPAPKQSSWDTGHTSHCCSDCGHHFDVHMAVAGGCSFCTCKAHPPNQPTGDATT